MYKDLRPSRTLKFKDTLNLLLGALSVAVLLSAAGVSEWAEGLSVNKVTKWIILGTESWNEASDDFGLNFARNRVRSAFFEFKDLKFFDDDFHATGIAESGVDADQAEEKVEEQMPLRPGAKSRSKFGAKSGATPVERQSVVKDTRRSIGKSETEAASADTPNDLKSLDDEVDQVNGHEHEVSKQDFEERGSQSDVAKEPSKMSVRKFGEISDGEKRLLAQGISQIDEEQEENVNRDSAAFLVEDSGGDQAGGSSRKSNNEVASPESVVPETGISAAMQSRKADVLKKHILLMGDSMLTSGLHVPLKRNLKRVFTNAAVDVEGHPGTGLAKPKFFNWSKKLTEYQKKFRYDLIVVFLGTNDAQNFLFNHRVHKFASKNWDSVYADRALHLIEQACGMADHVVWMGQLPMKDNEFDSKMKHIDELMSKTLQDHKCSSFMPALHWVESEGGGFASIKPVPSGRAMATQGAKAKTEQVQIRGVDGIHFSLVGARHYSRLLAEQIAESIKKESKTDAKADTTTGAKMKEKTEEAHEKETSDVSRESISDANL